MIKAGLIGLGKMGVSHLAIIAAQDGVEVAGVCDNQRFVLSALHANTGISTFSKPAAMFDEAQLDCVIVATPTSSHFEIGMEAIARGISVFIEKPLTLSAEQSRQLADAARSAGVISQVGYHNRFIGTFSEVARLVGDGAIGRVHHIDGRAFGNVITGKSGVGKTWRSSKSEGGGCLHDYACHVIDLMNFVNGPPQRIAGAQLSSIYSKSTEDAVYAQFEYPDGATGLLQTNWSDPTYRKMTTTIELSGSGGKIYADRQEIRVFLSDDQQVDGYEPGWTVKYITELQAPVDFYVRGEEYSAQLAYFVQSCRERRTAGTNSFESAATTDWVVSEISRVATDGTGGGNVVTNRAPSPPTIREALVPWIDRAEATARRALTAITAWISNRGGR